MRARWVPLGPDGLIPGVFVELLKGEGTVGVDLIWVGETNSRWGIECGFVIRPRPDLGAWRMHSGFTMGGADHGWDSTFVLFANDDHSVESHRNAAHDSHQILAGRAPYPASLCGINIEGLEEDRARLLAAAIGIAAGKLSGMGGFDDIQSATARRLDPATIVGQAIAASTTMP